MCGVDMALATLRVVEYQRFLMALSVRPGRLFAISAHLVPIVFSDATMTAQEAAAARRGKRPARKPLAGAG